MGVCYSEFNYLLDVLVYFLQIWVGLVEKGVELCYQQMNVVVDDKCGKFVFVVLLNGDVGLLKIWQDICIYVGLFDGDESIMLELDLSCFVYVYVVCGSVMVNGVMFGEGDGVCICGEQVLMIVDGKDVEVLVFDLCLVEVMVEWV